jgi:hypothetical protein
MDQTVVVLSSLIEKRLLELADKDYLDEEDTVFDQEDVDRFF